MTDTTISEPIATQAGDAGNGGADAGVQPMAHEIRADRVEISQGGANAVYGQTVSIQQGGAGRVVATEMSVAQGGVALARVDRLHIGEGSGAFAVVAREASIREGGNVLLLFARNVSGNVRPLIDARAGAAIGGGLVLAALLLRPRR